MTRSDIDKTFKEYRSKILALDQEMVRNGFEIPIHAFSIGNKNTMRREFHSTMELPCSEVVQATLLGEYLLMLLKDGESAETSAIKFTNITKMGNAEQKKKFGNAMRGMIENFIEMTRITSQMKSDKEHQKFGSMYQ